MNNILSDSLSSVSHLSSLSLISVSPSLNPKTISRRNSQHHITPTQKPTPQRNSHPAPYHANPKTETATCNPAPQSIANPAPYHAIELGETNMATPYHEFAIHGSQPSSMVKPISRIRDPRPMIHNRSSTSTSSSWSE